MLNQSVSGGDHIRSLLHLPPSPGGVWSPPPTHKRAKFSISPIFFERKPNDYYSPPQQNPSWGPPHPHLRAPLGGLPHIHAHSSLAKKGYNFRRCSGCQSILSSVCFLFSLKPLSAHSPMRQNPFYLKSDSWKDCS